MLIVISCKDDVYSWNAATWRGVQPHQSWVHWWNRYQSSWQRNQKSSSLCWIGIMYVNNYTTMFIIFVIKWNAYVNEDDPFNDPKIKGEPSCSLMVARLNLATDEEALERVFSKWGKIKRLRLVRDIGIIYFLFILYSFCTHFFI